MSVSVITSDIFYRERKQFSRLWKDTECKYLEEHGAK